MADVAGNDNKEIGSHYNIKVLWKQSEMKLKVCNPNYRMTLQYRFKEITSRKTSTERLNQQRMLFSPFCLNHHNWSSPRTDSKTREWRREKDEAVQKKRPKDQSSSWHARSKEQISRGERKGEREREKERERELPSRSIHGYFIPLISSATPTPPSSSPCPA